jgi:putative toxin-antitoxin system antitoxin component (TIGR02293 family)
MKNADPLDRVLNSVEKVYESRERARHWLSRPNPRLDGRAPVTLLDSDDGLQRVEELLGQIDEGFFV